MKKMIALLLLLTTCYPSFSQETLQSVTVAGNTFNRELISTHGGIARRLTIYSDAFGYGSVGQESGITYLSATTNDRVSLGHMTNQGVFSGKLCALSNGNIGIGTPSPTYKLDINGGFRSGNNGSSFLYNGHADLVMSAVGRGNGGRAIVHGDGNKLVFNYDGDFSGGTVIGKNTFFAEAGGASFINTGNLGIGTSSPAYKLEVAGKVLSNAFDAGFKAKRGNNFNEFLTGETGEMAFYQSTTSGYPIWIRDNGYVGVGTLSPTARLQVGGVVRSYEAGFGSIDGVTSAKAYANFGSNNHGSILIGTNLYVSGNDNLKIANQHATMSGAAILIPGNGQPYQNSIVFYSKEPGAVTEDQEYANAPRMLITSSGNIGIGTTTPGDYRLAVEGVVGARKIKVTQEMWPDYVFDSSYNLAPLSHVEKFIKENNHLPEVPSAEEVKKGGLDLGNNQAVLLKKIEELTLYIIQMEKRIAELECNKK